MWLPVLYNTPSKEFICSAGDVGSIRGLGRFPWKRKWQPTPVFLSGKFHGRGPWWASVCRVAKGWTWLSMHALKYYTVGLVAYFIYNSVYMLTPLRRLLKEGNRASSQSYISQLCRYLNLSFDFHPNTLFSTFQYQDLSVCPLTWFLPTQVWYTEILWTLDVIREFQLWSDVLELDLWVTCRTCHSGWVYFSVPGHSFTALFPINS